MSECKPNEKHSLLTTKRRRRYLAKCKIMIENKTKKNSNKEWPARDFLRFLRAIRNPHRAVVIVEMRISQTNFWRFLFAEKKTKRIKPNRPTKIYVESNLSDNECHKILKRLIESCKKICFSFFYFRLCLSFSQRVSRRAQSLFCTAYTKTD